ncbi:MAG: hypothetical protein IRZ16_15485 [Myxococcaceae bacterium]|nr:hypothetical protein [Myxococcaceae bacterium]
MKAKDHAQLCAALIAAHGVLNLLTFGTMLVLSGVVTTFAMPEIHKELARNPGGPDFNHVQTAINGLFLLLCCFFAALVLLSAFSAWGVWKARHWGKVVAIIDCAIALLSFPLGTALGVYGLWFLIGPMGTEWFGSHQTDRPAPSA